MNTFVDNIRDKGLCLGCGICASITERGSIEMSLQSNGFIEPLVNKLNVEDESLIKEICPGVYLNHNASSDQTDPIWGQIRAVYSSSSTDKVVHYRGSSGGVISQIAISLLESSRVSAVLQIGGDADDYTRNTLKVSRTKEDVIACSSSRYAPSSVFDNILDILNNTNDTFAFIGKPCDISTLLNFLVKFPQYNDRFLLKVAILCAGLPSFKGTKEIIDSFNPINPIRNLQYRGKGWPGYFSFTDSDNREFRKSYNDSWGSSLNRYLNFRCKICPDGIGLQADIAVGDAWETEDGYPDFTEREGKSLVIIRTETGENIYRFMELNNDIENSPLKVANIKLMQPYQYERRIRVGARLLAFRLSKGKIVNFKGFQIISNSLKNKPKVFFKEFFGALKRIRKL